MPLTIIAAALPGAMIMFNIVVTPVVLQAIGLVVILWLA